MAHPTSVVGYVYKADTWCENCIVEEVVHDHNASVHLLNRDAEESLHTLANRKGIDWEDESSYDSDYFPKVIFGDTEGLDSCSNCHTLLDTSWGPDEVDRASDMLRGYILDYIDNGPRNSEFLDQVYEHLRWCNVDSPDQRTMDIYDHVRSLERQDDE